MVPGDDEKDELALVESTTIDDDVDVEVALVGVIDWDGNELGVGVGDVWSKICNFIVKIDKPY